jgi:hypothetical protein
MRRRSTAAVTAGHTTAHRSVLFTDTVGLQEHPCSETFTAGR